MISSLRNLRILSQNSASRSARKSDTAQFWREFSQQLSGNFSVMSAYCAGDSALRFASHAFHFAWSLGWPAMKA